MEVAQKYFRTENCNTMKISVRVLPPTNSAAHGAFYFEAEPTGYASTAGQIREPCLIPNIDIVSIKAVCVRRLF